MGEQLERTGGVNYYEFNDERTGEKYLVTTIDDVDERFSTVQVDVGGEDKLFGSIQVTELDNETIERAVIDAVILLRTNAQEEE